jgi:tRNA-splicing ligase RtcB
MRKASLLPIAVRGALMPDAHVGYGLPIGGVLAVKDAVIPYAVGVDIACRMRLTVLDMPVSTLVRSREAFIQALEKETRFGVGAAFEKEQRRSHAVMEEDWGVCAVTQHLRDKAWKQLGTSGGGNHFAEFGELLLDAPALGLEKGSYLALLTHSGSRGTGEEVADRYSKLAMNLRPFLPQELKHLAWLERESAEGREYWAAMQLMGKYAAANHELIHGHVLANLGAEVLAYVENHHNFAWEEEYDGERVIVHRKGATPAGKGVLGIVPGSMGSPGFVVSGRGNADALHSCSHGAGRIMSRGAAFKTLDRAEMSRFLDDAGVHLISGDLDEAPMAYKDIHAVMAAQSDLVDILARFEPRLVKMAPGNGGDKNWRFKKRNKETTGW